VRMPHDRYLTYLIVVGVEDDEIRHLCSMDGLVMPDVAELARLRYSAADRPQPFGWQDPTDKAAKRWLARRGILLLVRGDQTAREAVSILRSPIWRHPTEILLLGGHTPSVVVRFNQEHDLPVVTAASVGEFAVLFWDVGTMGLDQVTAYLNRSPLGDVYRDALAGGGKALAVADAFVQRLRPRPLISTVPGGGPGPRFPPTGAAMGFGQPPVPTGA